MTIGQWLGKIAGQWLGSTGTVDPNAMAGAASFSIGATGTLTNGASITPADMVGSASFSIATSGTLSAPEENSYGRSSVRLRAIVDRTVVVKGSKLVVAVGSATPRAAIQELITNGSAAAQVARISIKSAAAKAVAQESVIVRALGSAILYQAGAVGSKASTRRQANSAQITTRSGMTTATAGSTRVAYGKKVRLRAGTLDDAWGINNPSDEELAVIAYMLTQDKKYIIKNTNY